MKALAKTRGSKHQIPKSKHQYPNNQSGNAALKLEAGCFPAYRFGCGVYRKYGFTLRCPLGKFAGMSSSLTAGEMMQSSPSTQFAGVATLCFAVNCNESITRNSSRKLRPVEAG